MSATTKPADRFHALFKGWQDACACRARRDELVNHANQDLRESYEIGFEAGVGDRRKIQLFATLQYGHEPTILRAAEPEPQWPPMDFIEVKRCEHGTPEGYLCTKCESSPLPLEGKAP